MKETEGKKSSTGPIETYLAEWRERRIETESPWDRERPLAIYWPYNYFKNYLVDMSKGEEHVKTIDDYPIHIRLNLEFHDTLNKLAEETSDGFERHGFIAIDQEEGETILPAFFFKGKTHCVPGEVIKQNRDWCDENGINNIVGSLHSHPYSRLSMLDRVRRIVSYEGKLSVGDLYFLVKKKPEYVMGVAEYEENVFAFRTRETKDTNLQYLVDGDNQKNFKNFWYERHSMNYKWKSGSGGYVSRKDGRKLSRDDLWRITLDIASHHNLAIYRGKTDMSIIRSYPPLNKDK